MLLPKTVNKMTDAEIRGAIIALIRHRQDVRSGFGVATGPLPLDAFMAVLPRRMHKRRVARILTEMVKARVLTKHSVPGTYVTRDGRGRLILADCRVAAWALA